MSADAVVPGPQDEVARKIRPFTCSRCPATWTARSAAHCSGCHRLFATVALFDSHRTADGCCLHPDDVRGRDGKPRLWFRDGMWRSPELTDEQRAKLKATVWGGEPDEAIPA